MKNSVYAMTIKVRVLKGPLIGIVGESEVSIQYENRARVIDILKLLSKKYGKPFRDFVFSTETGEVNSYIIFGLNGVNVSCLKGIETEIEDDSELLILSATGGG